MAEPTFPQFANFPSSGEFEKLLSSISKTGLKRGSEQNRFNYFLSLCRYTCTVPQWDEFQHVCQYQYELLLMDMEIMKKINDIGILNISWAPFIASLCAIAVPNDGHSVFHAISMAMWGLGDTHNTVRHLMEKSVTDMANNLYARWLIHNSSMKLEEKQIVWLIIIAKLEGKSSVLNERENTEYDSLILYILANVIQRPIILIDCSSNNASSHSVLARDVSGIYLPLEKKPSDCCRSPIILCYRDHYFCPLMTRSSSTGEFFFPLVKGNGNMLPIKYRVDNIDATAVIQQYLDVQEINLHSDNGCAASESLLCSKVSIMELPSHLNSIDIHYRKCKEMFQEFLASKKSHDSVKRSHDIEKQKVLVPPSQHLSATSPFNHIDDSNQTYVVRNADCKLHDKKSSSSSLGNFFAIGGSELPGINHQTLLATKKTSDPQSGPSDQLCLTPGCVNERDPGIGDLCDTCFKMSTIEESGLQLVSFYDEGRHGYTMFQAHSPPQVMKSPDRAVTALNETLHKTNDNQAYSELTSEPLFSVENKSRTHPYCVECSKSKNTSENPNEKYTNQNALSDKKSNVVHHTEHYNVIPQHNLTTEKKVSSPLHDSKEIPFSHHFCRTQGCHSLKQNNCGLCSQCITETNLKPHQAQHISSQKVGHLIEFGQAEVLELASDEDVIEISESPTPQCDAHKCGSPVCETIVSLSEILCEKCKSVLISHSKHATRTNEREHLRLRGVKSDLKNQQTISSHRTGTFSDIIAGGPPIRAIDISKKAHSEKLMYTNREPLLKKGAREIKKSHFTGAEMKFTNAKGEVKEMKKISYPSSLQSSVSNSVTPNFESAPNSTILVTQPPTSLSRAVDSEFHMMYEQFTKDQRPNTAKCCTTYCQNYGNKQKGGYCNSCFSLLSDQDKHIAIFGKTVPDLHI